MALTFFCGISRYTAAVVTASLLLMLLVADVAIAQGAAEPAAAGAQAQPENAVEVAPEAQPARVSRGVFYANPFWLALVVFAIGIWLHVTSWVSDDARGVGLDFPKAAMWHMAAGGVGVVLTLLIHAAFAFLLLALVLTCFSVYIVKRNKVVPEKFRFLGPAHRAELLARMPVLNKLGPLRLKTRTARESVPLRNESGQSLDDLTAEQPALSEAAGILTDLIVRAAVTATRTVRLQPAGDQHVAQFVLDGVLHNVEAFEVDLGQQVLACSSQFAGLAKGGKIRRGSAKLYADLPGVGQIEIGAQIASADGKPLLQLSFPNWTRELHRAGLGALGMHEVLVKRVKAAVDQRLGALLVASPPGCGKTTTLYSIARTIDVFTTDVATIEKEEEYELEHIRRWTLAPDVPFAQLHKEVLREIPEVLMFGEIESPEHAQALLSFAADQGLVLTTFRSNSAPDALVRLVKLAGEADLVNRSVTCVAAQQLVRKVCTHCREEIEPNPAVLKKLNINPASPGVWYRPVGCDACLNSGYHGRTGIFSMLILTDPIKEALSEPDSSAEAIRRVAGKAAYRTMYQDGVAKVTAGITTLDEIRRVLRGQ